MKQPHGITWDDRKRPTIGELIGRLAAGIVIGCLLAAVIMLTIKLGLILFT